MPSLSREPLPVPSLDHLLAAARDEAEAARSAYARLADDMRAQGRGRLAEVLTQIAAEEAELRELVPAPPRATTTTTNERHLDVEGFDAASAELADDYAIWAMAARNADRAFARWSYAAAHAPDADVRAGAEQLARAQLILASARRLRRRAAFHADKRAEKGGGAPLTLDRLESHLSGLLACHGIVGSPTYDPHLAAAAEDSRRAAAELASMQTVAVRPLSQRALGNPAVLAEAIVEGYFDGMNAARDDASLTVLQKGAAGAVRRLELLRSRPA